MGMSNLKPSGIRRVMINGRAIAARVDGAGPPVVLETGAGTPGLVSAPGQLDTWSRIRPQLMPRASVITYDRAGFGASDPIGYSPTVADRAKDLAALLDGLSIVEPVVIAGHSYGGLLAQYFAAAYPQRTAGILLMDTTPANVFSVGSRWQRWLARLQIPVVLFISWLLAASGFYKTERGQGLLKKALRSDRYPAEVMNEMIAFMANARGYGNIWRESRRLNESCNQLLDLLREQGLPDVPMIVQSASYRDVMASSAQTIRDSHAATASSVARGELRVMPADVGHGIPLEAPESVVADILEILTMNKGR